jgi:hypothetical protein
MKTNHYIALLAATAISVGGAGLAVMNHASQRGMAYIDEEMFPDLDTRLDRIAQVRIETGEGVATLAHEGDRWLYRELDGIPVDRAKVEELVTGLTKLRLMETRTNREDRLVRLELNDAPVEDETTDSGLPKRAARVTLLDAEGKVLADLFAGKHNWTLGQGAGGGIYVRFTDNPQSYLAQGDVKLPYRLLEFVSEDDRRLANIEADKVTSIRETGPDGAELLSLVRDAEGKAVLPDLPEGKEMQQWQADRLMGIFSGLRFDGLMTAEARPMPDTARTLTATVSIPVAAPVASEEDGGDAPAEAETAEMTLTLTYADFPAEGEERDPQLWATLSASGPDSIAAEVDAINNKAEGRVFKLDVNKREALNATRDDMMKDPDNAG